MNTTLKNSFLPFWKVYVYYIDHTWSNYLTYFINNINILNKYFINLKIYKYKYFINIYKNIYISYNKKYCLFKRGSLKYFNFIVQSLSCVWLCDPMDCSMAGSAVLHHLPVLSSCFSLVSESHSVVSGSVTPWTIQSTEFSRPENEWVAIPFPRRSS